MDKQLCYIREKTSAAQEQLAIKDLKRATNSQKVVFVEVVADKSWNLYHYIKFLSNFKLSHGNQKITKDELEIINAFRYKMETLDYLINSSYNYEYSWNNIRNLVACWAEEGELAEIINETEKMQASHLRSLENKTSFPTEFRFSKLLASIDVDLEGLRRSSHEPNNISALSDLIGKISTSETKVSKLSERNSSPLTLPKKQKAQKTPSPEFKPPTGQKRDSSSVSRKQREKSSLSRSDSRSASPQAPSPPPKPPRSFEESTPSSSKVSKKDKK